MEKELAKREIGRMKQNIIATAKKIAKVTGDYVGSILIEREKLLLEMMEDADRLLECEDILAAEKNYKPS